MKLTESMLRKMIQEESRKAAGSSKKRKQKINESLANATEELYSAVENYLSEFIDQSDFEDAEGACAALKSEIDGICSGFLGEYQEMNFEQDA